MNNFLAIIVNNSLIYLIHFSILKPAILSKSLILLVTKITLRLFACDTINISNGPIRSPFRSNSARIFQYSTVAS